jgi:hypothetical protein
VNVAGLDQESEAALHVQPPEEVGEEELLQVFIKDFKKKTGGGGGGGTSFIKDKIAGIKLVKYNAPSKKTWYLLLPNLLNFVKRTNCWFKIGKL